MCWVAHSLRLPFSSAARLRLSRAPSCILLRTLAGGKGRKGTVIDPRPASIERKMSTSQGGGGKESQASPPTSREVPAGFKLIEEGTAAMLFSEGEVFYNKVQVLNRDLSITIIRLFAERRLRDKMEKALKKEGLDAEAIKEKLADIDWREKVKEKPEEDGLVILDALAASGLRSIRYMKEIPGVKKVVVNDLDELAVEQAKKNVEYNQVDATRVVPNQSNATLLMLQAAQSSATQFDVVDIDPYGSAAPFLDAAVQAVADGGLLCVTCTDMAVLNGNHPEACYAKYRAVPTKGRYMHEMAVRIALSAIEAQANRYKRYIEPLMGVAVDFYLRVFVRVYTSPAEVKKSILKQSYVHQSLGCSSFYLQPCGRMTGSSGNYTGSIGPTCPPTCTETGKQFKLGGPFWSAPIHDSEWVMEAANRVEEATGKEALPTRERLLGLLVSVSEELVDVPLYYTLKDLCGTVHCVSPRMDEFKAALINGGYRVSNQHYEPQAIKTDAPPHVVWDIIRTWVKRHPVGERAKKEGTPAAAILSKEPEFQANFSIPAVLRQPKKKVKRYPPNPEAFWGPKSRARPGRKRKIDEVGGEAAAGGAAAAASTEGATVEGGREEDGGKKKQQQVGGGAEEAAVKVQGNGVSSSGEEKGKQMDTGE